MSNAERQQLWRDHHRPARPGMQITVPASNLLAPAPVPPPAALAMPVALPPKQIDQTHVRQLPAAQKLQLARLILDDVAGAL